MFDSEGEPARSSASNPLAKAGFLVSILGALCGLYTFLHCREAYQQEAMRLDPLVPHQLTDAMHFLFVSVVGLLGMAIGLTASAIGFFLSLGGVLRPNNRYAKWGMAIALTLPLAVTALLSAGWW